MKKYAVIVAAGAGSRMNSSLPKQFLLLKNKPILFYPVNAFLNTYDDLEVILVLPQEYISIGQEMIDGYFQPSRIQICAGGRTRFHSVQNGLSLIKDESVIFVHDGVRCMVSSELIIRSYNAALEFGTSIPVKSLKDSARIIMENGNKAIDRNIIKLVQTPQAFHSKILLPAYKIDYKEKFTDEATVVEAYGLNIHLIEGEESNIKITEQTDLLLAEKLIDKL